MRYADGLLSDITERKRAEEALREAEARYRRLFEVESDAILLGDSDTGRFLEANPAALKMYGYSREEFLGLTASEISTEQRKTQTAMAEGKTHVPLRWHRKKDGTVFPVEITANFFFDQGRRRQVAAIRDVSERQRTEEALRTTSETLRALIQASPFPILALDPQGHLTLWNAAAERTFGYSEAEVLGKIPPVVPEEEREWFLQSVNDVLKGATHSGIELRRKTKGGAFVDVSLWSTTLRDSKGEGVGVMALYADLTQRKRAEAEHVRLVTAIEQSAEAVVITNPAGDIEYVNPAFTRITGYGREEVLGQNPRILKSGEQAPAFYQQLWATISKGQTWHGELINRGKDGSFYTEQMNIAAVRGAHGKVTHFIATKQDVTERKSLEDQVRQATKMEAVGRLAGGVAHDFNNLLTIINGYSELLMDKFASDNQASVYLKEVKDAGERAASLTRQLLAFSRRQVLDPQVLDLNSVVSDMEKMLRRLIGEDITLHTLLDPSLGRVKADLGQIEQVIMNLAVNARDAMPRGGNLTIETGNVELDEAYARSHVTVKPGPHVMAAISDNGLGMTPETQARIFEPFFTTKEMGKGTGLGLATVYGIVKQSGGSIWVYSELGHGTVFKVYLPSVGENLVEKGDSMRETDPARGSETVLVVEDEEGVRSLICLTLESVGYVVLETGDAGSALTACANHDRPIHLLLSDVVMPQMSGPLVAEKIAALRPGIKVLYMS